MKPIDTLLLQISLLVAHVASGTVPLLLYTVYTLRLREFELFAHRLFNVD
jgi:hypothetical protein